MKYLPSHETHELHAAPSWGESSTRCQGHQLFVNGCAGWIYRGCPKIVVPQNDHRLNSRKSCFQLIPTLHFAGGFGPLKSLTTNGETWSSSHFGLGKALKGSSFAPTHSHICILVEIQQILPKSKNQWQLEGSVGSTAERPPHQILPVLRPRLIRGQVERPCKTYRFSCLCYRLHAFAASNIGV